MSSISVWARCPKCGASGEFSAWLSSEYGSRTEALANAAIRQAAVDPDEVCGDGCARLGDCPAMVQAIRDSL